MQEQHVCPIQERKEVRTIEVNHIYILVKKWHGIKKNSNSSLESPLDIDSLLPHKLILALLDASHQEGRTKVAQQLRLTRHAQLLMPQGSSWALCSFPKWLNACKCQGLPFELNNSIRCQVNNSYKNEFLKNATVQSMYSRFWCHQRLCQCPRIGSRMECLYK
jgi:hypothetical protein